MADAEIYDCDEIDRKLADLKIPKKTSELTNDSGFATRQDIIGSGIPKADLASDVKASLSKADTALQASDFNSKQFKTAISYDLNDADANGVKDRAINKTTASAITIPADFTDLILRTSGAVTKLTMTGIASAYGDDLPTEGNNLITVTRIAEDAVFVKVVAMEDNSYAGA